jgi:hypothetical protein
MNLMMNFLKRRSLKSTTLMNMSRCCSLTLIRRKILRCMNCFPKNDRNPKRGHHQNFFLKELNNCLPRCLKSLIWVGLNMVNSFCRSKDSEWIFGLSR